MNRNQGQVSWISVVVIISLLLFKGVAAAAMLCCGPDHGSHSGTSAHHALSAAEKELMHEHSAHSSAQHAAMMAQQDLSDSDTKDSGYQSSCSGCAVSCTAAVLMINPSENLSEKNQTERILSSTPFVFPLTASGLERPPRCHS